MSKEDEEQKTKPITRAVNAEPMQRLEPLETDPRCDLCGAPMLDRHCKLVCVQCGYQRDCSDP